MKPGGCRNLQHNFRWYYLAVKLRTKNSVSIVVVKERNQQLREKMFSLKHRVMHK